MFFCCCLGVTIIKRLISIDFCSMITHHQDESERFIMTSTTMSKQEKKAHKEYSARQEFFIKNHLSMVGDNLVTGHKFLEEFKKTSTYYTSFGFDVFKNVFRYSLVALLEVNDPVNTYYRTSTTREGQMYVAVFMRESRSGDNDNYHKMPMYMKWAEQNPVTLFFLGCDDGSYSKRFKSEEAAIAYMKKFNSLDAVLNDNEGPALFKAFLAMEKEEQTEEMAFLMYDNVMNCEN